MGVNAVIFTDCSSIVFARTSGAYRIASELRSKGYTVQVVEHFMLAGLRRTLEVLDKFVDESTLFVGFSTTFMNVSAPMLNHMNPAKNKQFTVTSNLSSRKTGSGLKVMTRGVPICDEDLQDIRNLIKSKNPNTKLVMGGTKADWFAQPEIDTFIIGYADTSIIEYAKYLEGKNPFFQYRLLEDGRMVIDTDTKGSKFCFQQSAIEYHESDLIEDGEVLPIETARGCIFKCKFCSFPLIGKKKNDHIKDPEVLYREFMTNYDKFKTTKYIFVDDTYNESVAKLEQFSEVVQRLPFKIEYVGYLRHDLLHRYPEMADLLKDSGLKVAVFGVETLNHTAGKLIGKGLDPVKAREMFTDLRESKGWKDNILMSSGFIVGLPTETEASVTKWAEELLDYSYPLDTFIINALGLTPDAKRLHKSEFEINYEQYGYYFDSKKSSGWINEHWDYDRAQVLANEITSYGYHTGRMKSYGFIAMMLHNYGYDWKKIFNTSGSFCQDGIFDKTVAMTDKYYERLLAK
jgi:radical SAM superfamily enzyme YgiQ (UPF0313 family)